MENTETFGDRMRYLRTEKNLSQAELGRLLEVSPSAIGFYERNEREPTFKLLMDMAKMFNASIDYLLCNSDERLTVENYNKQGVVDLEKLIADNRIEVHGYELDTQDKRRLSDVAYALFWDKFKSE